MSVLNWNISILRDENGARIGLDEGGYYDMTLRDAASEMRNETVLALEEMGIGVDKSHHEVAISQHEIDMRYTDALTMADQVMTYRLVVKEIADQAWLVRYLYAQAEVRYQRQRHACPPVLI